MVREITKKKLTPSNVINVDKKMSHIEWKHEFFC